MQIYQQGQRGSALMNMLTGIKVAFAGVPLLLCSFYIHANDVTLTFKYTVLQGTCDVSVPATVNFSGGTAIPNGSAALNSNWKFVYESAIPVTLSNCAGSAQASTAPYLTLDMQSINDFSSNGDRQKYLFSDPGNNTGFGVAIVNDITQNFLNGSTGNLVSADAKRVKLGENNTVAQNGINNVKIALSCGPSGDCTAARLHPGSMTTTIKFAFEYL